MKKRFALLALLLSLALVVAGCGSSSSSDEEDSSADASTDTTEDADEEETENVTITVGANLTPHSEILYEAQPLLAELGITLEVVEIEDSVIPNTSLVEGSIDANYFQHLPYLEDFNEENGTDLVSIGAIHYEPFGIYAGQAASLDEIEEGDTIAIPNNTTNEARALLLLEQEGLITLDEDAGVNATILDIVDNPLNLDFVEVAPENLVNTLPDVAVAIINGNYALEGGLDVNDALAVEANDGLAAQTYGNIIAVRAEDAENEALLTLVEVLQGEEISEFITETYNGAVVPLYTYD